MSLNKWLYRGGRPNRTARVLGRMTAALYARGIAPNYLVTLEVRGRKTGRTITMPLVMVVVEGERYLVSMLGEQTNWVRNVRAAGGSAALRHGRREAVRLEEVAAAHRVPVLRSYLQRAPSGSVHLPVDQDTPQAEFERVAYRVPVFRVVAADARTGAEAHTLTPQSDEADRDPRKPQN